MALLDILKKKKEKKSVSEKSTNTSEMGLEKKKPKEKKKKEMAKKMPASADSGKTEKFSHIIIRPRITEKASAQSGGNSYTFEVSKNANKIQIKNAIQEVYGVEPIKVNVINAKPKAKMVRNIWGKTASYKKAIVFLKEGDSIEFV